MDEQALYTSLLRANPALSPYRPLSRILLFDRFSSGFHGWEGFFPDYDGWEDYPGRYEHAAPVKELLARSAGGNSLRIDQELPRGSRAVPMLSSLTSWDLGTAGAWSGNYALKIPSLPVAGHKAFAQKRLNSPWLGCFRIETYFTFKAEPSDFRLGETDVAAIYLTFDVMDPQHAPERRRWWPCLRYHNAENGRLVQHWQANLRGSRGVKDGAWTNLQDGAQELGFNRSPTKYQWHYLRYTFDLGTHSLVDFNCHGKEFDVQGKTHAPDPPLQGYRASTEKCPGLIGTGFGIETAAAKRCFLYLDSVLVSVSEASLREQGLAKPHQTKDLA